MNRRLAAYNPLSCQGTEMLPQLQLVCKLSFLVVLIKGYYLELEAPFIPFIHLLDLFHGSEMYTWTLRSVFFLGGGLLLFNKWPKFGATLMGSVLLIHLLGTRLDFKNHVFLTACIFLICGLAPNKHALFIYRLQFALIYFGATLNKLLEPDWRTGHFFRNWMEERLNYPFLADIAHATHPTLVYAASSWSTIVIEAAMVFLILIPKYNRAAIWIAAGFHFSTTVFTGGTIFGFFVPGLLIAFLGFDQRNTFENKDVSNGSHFEKVQKRLKQNIFTYWILFSIFWIVHLYSPHRFFVQTLLFTACYVALFPYTDTQNWLRNKTRFKYGTPLR